MLRKRQVNLMIVKEIETKFKDLEGVGVINPRGIDATKTNQLRRRLRGKGFKVYVVKNSLARRASGSTKIKGFEALLQGPSAVVYGKGSGPDIARALMDEKKLDAKLELRGIFFDGEAYVGDDGVKKVSKFPTRQEAIATVVAAMLSPGKKLAGAIKGQPGKIAALIKAVEEKAKEKEAAAAAAAPPVAAAPAAEAPAPVAPAVEAPAAAAPAAEAPAPATPPTA
jgi:large subunit ribosomal protein L10